ncbi:hypothetical protein Tco_1245951 [Tanacetum coccineum]
MAQQQQQQIIPANQLVSNFQSIGRCNNYVVLQNIPCSVECKIVGQILIDHALGYALKMTADVPAVYIQQFWKTIKQVSNANDTIRFTTDRETITYNVDMFRDTLKLPVETLDNPFIETSDLKFIQIFLKIVGYEGIVDKTKINILQIFHAVINRVHVDYAGLLWWDFIHCVQRKKDVIQYSCFTKLIIVDLMKKFPSIAQRLDENYHSIKDDIPLVSVYTTRNMTVRGMLIPDVPTIQPQPVESTQGLNRIPRATRTPTPTVEVVKKKRKSKAIARESSTLRKSLKVKIKQKKPSTTSIPPPSDDRERDEIHEATQLSIIMHKTAIIAEAQENVAKVQENLLKEDIDKMVEGEEDEESYAIVDDNVDKEKKNDDVEEKKDDNDDHDDHELVRNKVSGSLETRNEQTQTPIPSPPRSPKTDLSSDKTLSEELTSNVSPTPDTTSKDPSMSQPTSSTSKILPRSVDELSRRRGQLREQLTNAFITKEYFEGKMKEMSDTLNNLVPGLTIEKTNGLIKEAIPRMVNDAVKKDREIFAVVVSKLVSKEFATHAPKIIEELFMLHMKNKVLNVHPTVSISTAKTTAELKQQLYLKMKIDLQAQAADLEM